MTDNPFQSTRISARRNTVIVATMLAVSVTTVFLFTRRNDARSEQATHAHATASSPVARPVMIPAEAAQRIGVTYALVTLAPMTDEIRTVAQVTYDETRVTSISPKIDGWVEQLYVNYNGQPVSAGQALLSVYSPMLVSAEEELLLATRLSRSLSDASGEAQSGSRDLSAAARRRLQYWDIS